MSAELRSSDLIAVNRYWAVELINGTDTMDAVIGVCRAVFMALIWQTSGGYNVIFHLLLTF